METRTISAEGGTRPFTNPAAATGKWGMRRTAFRHEGRPHTLVVITDLSRELREEELKAWQRLVRVLGHELNNSLAPIKSIAGSLRDGVRREKRAADWEEDLRAGLEIIASRADGLGRFLQAYAQLARLPAPALAACELGALLHRVVALETRIPVVLREGAPVLLRADGSQVEQALINLVRNAADAALERRTADAAHGGREDAGVRVGWRVVAHCAEIAIEDDGFGIADSANLFVPFFTTKPQGSGIGLVLCRQIAENHGGSLELRNRGAADGTGCVALMRMPLASERG